MKYRTLVVVVFLAGVLLVPTAAVTSSPENDGVNETVELSPHDGPNGEYASIQDGELRVDFERLNDDAVTRAHDVFNVTSTAEEPIEVWVEADPEGVDAYEGEDPGAIFDGTEGRVLQPGETLPVGFAIDTHGSTPDSGAVTIRVEEPDGDSTDGDSDTGGTGGVTTPTATPTPPDGPDLVDRTVGVEVVFEGDGNYEATTVRTLDSLPPDGPAAPPTADIGPGRLHPTVGDDGLSVHGTRFVAQEDQPVRLTGSQSYVSTADSVVREPRPAAIVDITPPVELRDSPALVRIRVTREDFPETAATDARIGRHTPRGWQVLPTRVVESDEETVLLEARTQGFSVFTVFAESDVAYRWSLPDGRTVRGNDLRTSFATPGPRNLTLTVTDAFGRSDDARQEILVNDRPSVAVEQHRNGTDGELTTLRANVTDEYGNATVTWALPDGSTATGETVTGEFASGETVEVVVEDEFGASATATTTVGGAAPGQSGLTQLPFGLPAWAWLLLALTAVALAGVLARAGLPGRVGGLPDAVGRVAVGLLADDSPRITSFEDARWNPAADRVEIESLEVVAPSGTLSAVEFSVTDADGTPVVTRTVELGARGSYSASPEYVPVYGDLELSSDGSYSVEVRAVDDRDRVGVAGRTALGPTGTGV